MFRHRTTGALTPNPILEFAPLREERATAISSTGENAFVVTSGCRAFLVQARLDLSKPINETASRFLVFDPTPGFLVGRVEGKMGLRSLQLSELIRDDVYVPSENLLGAEGGGASIRGLLFETVLPRYRGRGCRHCSGGL
jgi:alkylation response protein AidB-like acyl-CoA dehydrogenase